MGYQECMMMGNRAKGTSPRVTCGRELPGNTSREDREFQGFELVRECTDLEFASVSLCVN